MYRVYRDADQGRHYAALSVARDGSRRCPDGGTARCAGSLMEGAAAGRAWPDRTWGVAVAASRQSRLRAASVTRHGGIRGSSRNARMRSVVPVRDDHRVSSADGWTRRRAGKDGGEAACRRVSDVVLRSCAGVFGERPGRHRPHAVNAAFRHRQRKATERGRGSARLARSCRVPAVSFGTCPQHGVPLSWSPR